jgi:RNA polymerase sigma factor (TIGR02999 family)
VLREIHNTFVEVYLCEMPGLVDKLSRPSDHGWMSVAPQPVTQLLQAWRSGDQAAFDQLMPLVYDELHRLADIHLRGERAGHTFRPTDLVSEAYMRLSKGTPPSLNDRIHFFAVAARSMRQILIDHARKRRARKRAAGEAVELDADTIGTQRAEDLVALDDALQALTAIDERKGRIVELHYFGGLTQEEIATLIGVHANTVARDLRLGEAWLHRQLRHPA